MAGELDRQIAGKAIWAFDNGVMDAIAGNAMEPARIFIDRIGTTGRSVKHSKAAGLE
jgi:hypothetical protein